MQTKLVKPTHDDFIIAGDQTFHVLQWGDQGRPIIFIHGITANAYFFQAFADELATDHCVIAYDLRGRGDSDKPEEGYGIPIHVQDLAELIDELGLERPVVVGHSLGAMIALYFAAHYPDKLSKLVLIDAGAELPWKSVDEQPAWLTASFSRLGVSVPSFDEYIRRLKAAPFLGPYWNEYVDSYFEHDVFHNSDGSVVSKCYREGILEDGYRLFENHPEEQWQYVNVPTLLLRAGQGLFSDDDQLLPLESALAIQRNIKNCRFSDFPTLNHYTVVLAADSVLLQRVRHFVEEEI
ncbi:MAG TPA: alpha/beta hydrolase [Ktedonobacteraceae bacterium]|nr:alpha/beta hydrolase [Ktedonobacteraceae bacterium]